MYYEHVCVAYIDNMVLSLPVQREVFIFRIEIQSNLSLSSVWLNITKCGLLWSEIWDGLVILSDCANPFSRPLRYTRVQL